eukprot:Clim_evm81s150 gene=Clim_evmTU81s150
MPDVDAARHSAGAYGFPDDLDEWVMITRGMIDHAGSFDELMEALKSLERCVQQYRVTSFDDTIKISQVAAAIAEVLVTYVCPAIAVQRKHLVILLWTLICLQNDLYKDARAIEKTELPKVKIGDNAIKTIFERIRKFPTKDDVHVLPGLLVYIVTKTIWESSPYTSRWKGSLSIVLELQVRIRAGGQTEEEELKVGFEVAEEHLQELANMYFVHKVPLHTSNLEVLRFIKNFVVNHIHAVRKTPEPFFSLFSTLWQAHIASNDKQGRYGTRFGNCLYSVSQQLCKQPWWPTLLREHREECWVLNDPKIKIVMLFYSMWASVPGEEDRHKGRTFILHSEAWSTLFVELVSNPTAPILDDALEEMMYMWGVHVSNLDPEGAYVVLKSLGRALLNTNDRLWERQSYLSHALRLVWQLHHRVAVEQFMPWVHQVDPEQYSRPNLSALSHAIGQAVTVNDSIGQYCRKPGAFGWTPPEALVWCSVHRDVIERHRGTLPYIKVDKVMSPREATIVATARARLNNTGVIEKHLWEYLYRKFTSDQWVMDWLNYLPLVPYLSNEHFAVLWRDLDCKIGQSSTSCGKMITFAIIQTMLACIGNYVNNHGTNHMAPEVAVKLLEFLVPDAYTVSLMTILVDELNELMHCEEVLDVLPALENIGELARQRMETMTSSISERAPNHPH